ncbi:MAG: hypothetical protein AAF411_27060 [Myxococcota bacterium]
MQTTRELTEVTEEYLGGGLAGELILDTAYFFGGLVHEGDLALADTEALQRFFDEQLTAFEALSAGLQKHDGLQLAFIIEGDLVVDGPLWVGAMKGGLNYCLAVHGSLRAQGVGIDAYSHANVTGDLHAPLLFVAGSDGAMVHCGGTATVTWFVHDQDQHPISFASSPTELKTYDVDGDLRSFASKVKAVRDGRDLRASE